MNGNPSYLTEEQNGKEMLRLADLNVEHCIDEMFRPFLHSNEAQKRHLEVQPVATGAPENALSVESFSPVIPRPTVTTSQPLPDEAREELLELRSEVMQVARTRGLQTLMVCGVESGVGTSFVAGQLSRLLAEFVRMKVALLTIVPGREKKISRLGRRTELSPQLQFLLRRTELFNLTEIASCHGTISLPELLGSCDTSEVLRQMKQEFDLIVIDAPAIATFRESALLAAWMDGVILVAEPHVTPLRRVDSAHRRLHKAEANILGMVFNRQHRL